MIVVMRTARPSLAGHLVKEFASPARGEQSPACPLQGRELDVLQLVVQGMTDNEIGKELFISPRTVQNHLTRIREKTGLRRGSDGPPDEADLTGGVREPRGRPPDNGSTSVALRPPGL